MARRRKPTPEPAQPSAPLVATVAIEAQLAGVVRSQTSVNRLERLRAERDDLEALLLLTR